MKKRKEAARMERATYMKYPPADAENHPLCRDGGNPACLALAMAYVPMQCLKNAYSLEQALMEGTLFPELNKPFMGCKGG